MVNHNAPTDLSERAIRHFEPLSLVVQTASGWPFEGIDRAKESCPARIEWSVTNVGTAAAFMTDLVAEAVVTGYPINVDFPIPLNRRSVTKLLLMPGESFTQSTEVLLDPSQGELFRTGGQCVVLQGFVKYCDALHETEHVARFCCHWRMNQDGTRYLHTDRSVKSYKIQSKPKSR